MSGAHILLVEDDIALAELMATSLERAGYTATVHHDGVTAEARIRELAPDLVILDVMLPGRDGFDICRVVKATLPVPVLMLTARSDDLDQVLGLELGADDYVVKPVAPRVLQARVKALLRRPVSAASRASSASPAAPPSGSSEPEAGGRRLTFGALQILPGSREARVSDVVVSLTDAEFDLLHYLAQHAGRVIEREELFQALRGIAYDGLDRSIDLRVSKLRSQLRDHLGGRSPIRTVHGRGYLFATTP